MQNRQFKRILYLVRYQYLTTNNMVLVLAAVVALMWGWSSVEAVQSNYLLQKKVDDKKRQQKLVELETQNLEFEQKYYKSNEYLTLEAKRRLGLVEPGEKVLILPPNSEVVKAEDRADQTSDVAQIDNTPPPPPLQQWVDFFFSSKPAL